MVQGSSSHCYLNSKMSTPTVDKHSATNKRTGYEAMKKVEESRRRQDEEKQKYGAWGSTFKNKEHFTNMHHC